MKLLILSNNPLSYSNSNGRTMLNMLANFSKSDLLNIFVNDGEPAFEKSKFYKVDEAKLIKRPFSKCFGCFQTELKQTNIDTLTKKQGNKTSLLCLIRSMIWKKRRLKNELINIALNFNPDVICVQCGDNDFLINISLTIAKKINKPIIGYNSEDYIFKKWNFINPKRKHDLFFNIFLKKLIKIYDCFYSASKLNIYLTDSLLEAYSAKYPSSNSCVIYNSSFAKESGGQNDFIVYSGNLGVGRSKTLIDISRLIYKYLNKKIIVYSTTSDAKILSDILSCDFIDFKGAVSYEKNISIISESFMNIHVESMDDFYLKDTCNAFSGKLADYISVCRPLIVLAPKSSFVYKYFAKNDCGFVFSDLKEFENWLSILSVHQVSLMDKSKKQKIISKENHSFEKNSSKFYNEVSKIVF